jgi:outer membrane lipoprotein SlyB
MKNLIALIAAGMTFVSANAQLLSHDSLNGALWGGLIGGIVGGDRCQGFSGNGAAIGAGIGLVAGSLASESRRYSYHNDSVSYYSPAPTISLGYGYGNFGSSVYPYRSPENYFAPGFYYRAARPNYAVSGTILGATSGALIGAGNRDAGRGALIGAAAGLALGSVAEDAKRREERVELFAVSNQAQQQTPVTQALYAGGINPGALPSPPKITSTPATNSTYFWTPRP